METVLFVDAGRRSDVVGIADTPEEAVRRAAHEATKLHVDVAAAA